MHGVCNMGGFRQLDFCILIPNIGLPGNIFVFTIAFFPLYKTQESQILLWWIVPGHQSEGIDQGYLNL